jgi:DNA-binding NarL/FixJ family response regulator
MASDADDRASRIRVVLGEDDFLARQGVIRVLEGLTDIELVASCGDLESLREAIARSAPDVVLTDVGLAPDHTDEGLRMAAELRSTHPEVGVVVLSANADPLHALELFADGSQRRGYLLKERLGDAEELRGAIVEVAGGGTVTDPHLIDELVAARRRGEDSPLHGLTARELQILGLIAEGYANAAIADRLAITKRGIERHINGMFAKLDLGDPRQVSRRVKATLVYLAGAGRGDARPTKQP